METLAFSHLACNEEDSTNKEFTACVDFKKLSTVGAMGLLSAATLAGAMTMNTESAAAYGYGSYGGYGRYGNYGGSSSYGKSSGHYYKKVVSSSYKRSYGRSSNYGGYGGYGRYGSYGGGYGGGGYGGGDCY